MPARLHDVRPHAPTRPHCTHAPTHARHARRLVNEGFNPTYGARPLRRAIMRLIEDCLAERILSGDIKVGGALGLGVRVGRQGARSSAAGAGKRATHARTHVCSHASTRAPSRTHTPPLAPSPHTQENDVVIMDVDPDGAIAVLAGDKKMRSMIDSTPAGIA